MTIRLKNPVYQGDVNSEGATEVRIVKFQLDLISQFIELECQYGKMEEKEWIPSQMENKYIQVQNLPPELDEKGNPKKGTEKNHYSEIVKLKTKSKEITFESLFLELQKWMLKNKIFTGSVESV